MLCINGFISLRGIVLEVVSVISEIENVMFITEYIYK